MLRSLEPFADKEIPGMNITVRGALDAAKAGFGEDILHQMKYRGVTGGFDIRNVNMRDPKAIVSAIVAILLLLFLGSRGYRKFMRPKKQAVAVVEKEVGKEVGKDEEEGHAAAQSELAALRSENAEYVDLRERYQADRKTAAETINEKMKRITELESELKSVSKTNQRMLRTAEQEAARVESAEKEKQAAFGHVNRLARAYERKIKPGASKANMHFGDITVADAKAFLKENSGQDDTFGGGAATMSGLIIVVVLLLTVLLWGLFAAEYVNMACVVFLQAGLFAAAASRFGLFD